MNCLAGLKLIPKHHKVIIVKKLLEKYPVLKICEKEIKQTVDTLCSAFESGNKLLVCGNGGSAADAEHIVGEMMKGFMSKRALTQNEKSELIKAGGDNGEYLAEYIQKPLPAISLVSSVALATAFANDVDPKLIFAQQVYGLGNPGDVLIGISTSGNAQNVAYAMTAARAKKIKTIALTGGSGGKLKELSDITVIVPGDNTPEIQELHLPVYHYICRTVESYFFGG